MNITQALSGYKERLDEVMDRYRNRYSLVRSYSNGEGGFSLIELIIVIATIGILTAIAVPNFMAFSKKAYEANIKEDIKKEVRLKKKSGLEKTISEHDNPPNLLMLVDSQIAELENQKEEGILDEHGRTVGFYHQDKEKIRAWVEKYETLKFEKEILVKYIADQKHKKPAPAPNVSGVMEEAMQNKTRDGLKKTPEKPLETAADPEKPKPADVKELEQRITKLEAENKKLSGDNAKLEEFKVKYIAVQEGGDPLGAARVAELGGQGYQIISIDEYIKRAEGFRGKKVRLLGEPVQAYLSESIMSIKIGKDGKFVDCTAADTKVIHLNDVQAANLYNTLQMIIESNKTAFPKNEITVYAEGNGENGLVCRAVRVAQDKAYRLLRLK